MIGLLFGVASAKSLYSTLYDVENEKPYVVLFVTPKNEYVDQYESEFNSTRDDLGDICNFIKVDVNKELLLGTRLRIIYTPVIYVFWQGKAHFFPNTEVTKDKIYSFIAQIIGKSVPMLKETDIATKKPLVAMFTKRLKAPTALSFAQFNLSLTDIRFAWTNNKKVIDAFRVNDIPSVYFFKDGIRKKYDGQTDAKKFIEEIRKHFNVTELNQAEKDAIKQARFEL
ncbi:hypothetical protein TVAG_438360 [Trichomonas vaginalis G3]|uniref:Thioredoxin domain-containing protein n=1 Tax=Trichomonas vaginalis (strain ATCC PRA-98 / G3) TaxID=412133 RepID=A2EYN2_TRIV3|nr:DNAJ protein ERDJ3A family [Trichomonas vaginalis G3]EAY02245.1 hypothetical protein TVAG_438360 [Trichomonas vaginalis G3]KAI5507283.1 DNAJ protein ERDJ3A family [Trichomonas vaginalis G3]|eukprot:XP_001330604.1 hypothetical protein [Trichomonas vaginalis G3]